jgi:hypothetical protein
MKMKTLNTRWGLIALVPLVTLVILSIGNRIGAAPDQNREVDWGDNGFIIQGGITQGQVLRCIVGHYPPGSNAHSGGVNLELRVFDSQGNLLVTYAFPNQNQNQNGGGVWISFFDLSAAQLPASAFDNTGRAQVTGIVRAIPGPHVAPGPENCGFVASGEIFNIGIAQTLVHIAGTPISRCR